MLHLAGPVIAQICRGQITSWAARSWSQARNASAARTCSWAYLQAGGLSMQGQMKLYCFLPYLGSILPQ